MAGNREWFADEDNYVAVSPSEPSRSFSIRETVSNSLRLFQPDENLVENDDARKPANQGADMTNHQMVADIANRNVRLKVFVQVYFADWTEVDPMELWSRLPPPVLHFFVDQRSCRKQTVLEPRRIAEKPALPKLTVSSLWR